MHRAVTQPPQFSVGAAHEKSRISADPELTLLVFLVFSLFDHGDDHLTRASLSINL